jgi:hypothetical protein
MEPNFEGISLGYVYFWYKSEIQPRHIFKIFFSYQPAMKIEMYFFL